jgi:hypothetical protein
MYDGISSGKQVLDDQQLQLQQRSSSQNNHNKLNVSANKNNYNNNNDDDDDDDNNNNNNYDSKNNDSKNKSNSATRMSSSSSPSPLARYNTKYSTQPRGDIKIPLDNTVFRLGNATKPAMIDNNNKSMQPADAVVDIIAPSPSSPMSSKNPFQPEIFDYSEVSEDEGDHEYEYNTNNNNINSSNNYDSSYDHEYETNNDHEETERRQLTQELLDRFDLFMKINDTTSSDKARLGSSTEKYIREKRYDYINKDNTMYMKLFQSTKPKYIKKRISKMQKLIKQEVKEFLLEFDYNFSVGGLDVDEAY